MRGLLLAAMLLLPDEGRQTIPAHSEWIGPMEFTDQAGVSIGPTVVVLDIAQDGTVTGRWHSTNTIRASGTFAGTLQKGALKLTVTVSGGAEATTEAGTTEVVAPEYCSGTGDLTGVLYPSGILRLTGKRITLDTPAKRVQRRACADMTRVIWTLQPHPIH